MLQAIIAARARRLRWYERGGKRTAGGAGEGKCVTVGSAITLKRCQRWYIITEEKEVDMG